MERNPKVDEYIAKAQPFAQPILIHLRELIFSTAPTLKEEIKWNFPCYSDGKNLVCSISAHKAHCTFGFWLGNDMPDPHGILERIGKTAMGSLGKITAKEQLPPDEWLAEYLHEAIALAKSGTTKSIKEKPQKPIYWSKDFPEIFGDFAAQAQCFDAFSPSHRREYIEWITEAKTENTRNKRIQTMLEWLLEGKSRNWKYER